MKCQECGGDYVEHTGALEISDKFIGGFAVPHVTFSKCRHCNDLLLGAETARAVEAARKAALDNLLQSQPISAFLSGSETAALLGISRQALHKHRRIRRGFVFQTRFKGTTVYLRESVKRFEDKGDGRFPLCPSPDLPQYATQDEIQFIKTGQAKLQLSTPSLAVMIDKSGEVAPLEWTTRPSATALPSRQRELSTV